MAETWRDMLAKAGPEEWPSYRAALRALRASTNRTLDELQELGAPIVRDKDVPGVKASPVKTTWQALMSDKRSGPPAWPQVELLVRIAAAELQLPTDDLVREWAAAYQKCGGSPGRFTKLAAAKTQAVPDPVSAPKAWWKRRRIPGAAAVAVSVVAALVFVLTGGEPQSSANLPAPGASTGPGASPGRILSQGPTTSPSASGPASRTPGGTPAAVPPGATPPGGGRVAMTQKPPVHPSGPAVPSAGPGDKSSARPASSTPPKETSPPAPAPQHPAFSGEVAWSQDGEGGAPESGTVEAYRTTIDSGPEWQAGTYPLGYQLAVQCKAPGRVYPVGTAYTGPSGRENIWYLIKNNPDLDTFVPAVYVDMGWSGPVPDC